MITKFKIYEYINTSEPKIGDYVILRKKEFGDKIGIITKKYGISYTVKFDDVSVNILEFDIKYWTDKKRNLEKH